MMTKLEMDGDVRGGCRQPHRRGDARDLRGLQPGAVLYASRTYRANQYHTGLVNAFYQNAQMARAGEPEQVASTVPQEYWLGTGRSISLAFKASKPAYSAHRYHFSRRHALANDMLVAFDEELRAPSRSEPYIRRSFCSERPLACEAACRTAGISLSSRPQSTERARNDCSIGNITHSCGKRSIKNLGIICLPSYCDIAMTHLIRFYNTRFVRGRTLFIAGHELNSHVSHFFIYDRWWTTLSPRSTAIPCSRLASRLIHLTAMAINFWTEWGLNIRCVFCSPGRFLNGFWLALLRRPAVSAALSLA